MHDSNIETVDLDRNPQAIIILALEIFSSFLPRSRAAFWGFLGYPHLLLTLMGKWENKTLCYLRYAPGLSALMFLSRWSTATLEALSRFGRRVGHKLLPTYCFLWIMIVWIVSNTPYPKEGNKPDYERLHVLATEISHGPWLNLRP